MKQVALKAATVMFGLFWLCYLVAFCLTCVLQGEWSARMLVHWQTGAFTLLFLLTAVIIVLCFFRKNFWAFRSRKVMEGTPRDRHLEANLEDSRFQTKAEIAKNFSVIPWNELQDSDIKGAVIGAEETKKGLQVVFAKPAHTLVIGTTGSGKTTTYVSPCIQILSKTKTKPSLLISDPKGELYQSHVGALTKRGYRVRVLDLRNPYSSARWNPLVRPYRMYRRAMTLEKEVTYDEEKGTSFFDGREYRNVDKREAAIQVKRQELIDTFTDFLRTPKGRHMLQMVHDMRKAGKTQDEIDIAVRREHIGKEAPGLGG